MHYYSHRDIDLQVALTFLPLLECHGGIRCFPSYADRWHFDNKIAQKYLADELGLPFVPTWVFWNYNDAKSFIDTVEYPLVLKLSFGAGSGNVIKVENKEAAKRLLDRSFYSTIRSGEPISPAVGERIRFLIDRFKRRVKRLTRFHYSRLEYWRGSSQYVMFQRFMPDNSFDTRVTVIGDRAFAFRRVNRPGDFRASGSGSIDYSPTAVDTRMIAMGFETADALGTNSLAIDFLYDENNKPRIGEFGYRYVTEALRECPVAWTRDLSSIGNDKTPELLHLETLLQRPLEMPRDLP